MTLLFADGFEDGTVPWTLGSSMALGTGRGGNGLVTGNTSSSAEVGFTVTAGPIITGFAFKPAGAGYIGGFWGSAGLNAHVILTRGSGGEIIVTRGPTSPVTIGTTATGLLTVGSWNYIELKTTIHDTTGIVVLKVNGVQVLNLTNVDTKDSSVTTTASLRLGAGVAGNLPTVLSNAWDDVYIADATGTVNNDFIGDVIVEHLRPVSDDTAQWLGSDANSVNNWDLVDEAGTFNGADYVASSTVGQRDLYTSTSSTKPITAPVAGVVAVAVAMKTDAGTRTVKLDIKEGSGGTVRASADLGLPTTFGEIRAVFDRKGDGTAWTVADVNNLRMGYEVST
jgi:hypothetical protein